MFRNINICLSFDAPAVFKRCAKMHMVERYRNDAPTDIQEAASLIKRRFKVPGDALERGQDDVAECMSFKASFFKSVVKKIGKHAIVRVSERNERSSHVSGWKDAEFFPKNPR